MKENSPKHTASSLNNSEQERTERVTELGVEQTERGMELGVEQIERRANRRNEVLNRQNHLLVPLTNAAKRQKKSSEQWNRSLSAKRRNRSLKMLKDRKGHLKC